MSRVPPETEITSLPALSVAEVAVELKLAAEFAERCMVFLAFTPMAGEIEKLKEVALVDDRRRLTALRQAAEAYRAFAGLPASFQLSIGVVPGSAAWERCA